MGEEGRRESRGEEKMGDYDRANEVEGIEGKRKEVGKEEREKRNGHCLLSLFIQIVTVGRIAERVNYQTGMG